MNFGRFEVIAELGQGAMGKVYRAHDPVLDRSVALKTVSPALLSRKDTLKRFEREARAAARLQHPNIVTIYEVGESEGTRYIAMELVEGVELTDVLAASAGYSIEQKVRIMADVCRGLDFAHKAGVVHRDVKPANIRVAKDGTVKIVDFGIARIGESDMTQAGIVLGTPSYISPELLQGAPVDPRTDMWAVGVILYEMLSGRRPFEAATISGLVHKIVHEPLPALDAARLGLPEALVAIVKRALDKDPAKRFPDLGTMANALVAAIGGSGAEVPLDPVVRRRAFEANFAEARRRLADDDLTGALDAARRAQSVDAGRTGIVDLIRVIEERIRAVTTIKSPPSRTGGPARSPTKTVVSERPPTPPTPVPPGAVPPGPLDTSTLRARGAGAFRDQGAFGEPPATKESALSPTADILAVAGTDGAIRLWDLRTRTRTGVLRTDLHRRTGHDAAALALAFSPDGSLLASAHVDGVVHLWDMAKSEEVPVKLRHDNAVGTLAFSPDGATLATGSLDANLRLWDVGAAVAGEARRELIRQPSAVTSLAWAAGGEWMLTGHARVVRLLDPVRGKLLASIRGPEGPVSLLVPSPDGRSMAAASHDRTVHVFDIATRQETARLGPLKRPATSLCFIGDGGFLATVCQDNSVQLWDLETRAATAVLWGPTDESFVSLALFGDWNAIAVALADGRIRTWGPAA
ncbi:MAG: serine/threonine-protein kinase [Vicinamibacteria bacterium]